MEFTIISYQGAGSIRLGMTQAEVRHFFQKEGREVRDLEFWESFHVDGVQVCYEDIFPYNCRAIMLYPPSQPIFHDRNLCNSPIKDLREWFQSMDESLKADGNGLISRKLGLHLSCESYKLFSAQPPTSVVVFEPGYYDAIWEM
jgi:hypothetical protein